MRQPSWFGLVVIAGIINWCTVKSLAFSIKLSADTTSWRGSNEEKSQDPLPSGSEDSISVVRAPLKFIGPYPCMSLRFPHLQTNNQRRRNVSGISLDFVLDTAANINTINALVAQELNLPVIGRSLPGVGAGGPLVGSNTYLLGDAEIDIRTDDPFIFIQNLTASSLPVASPAAAGLLSMSFFDCFPGGVDFVWEQRDGIPPSLTFYGKLGPTEGRVCVPIQRLPITSLPTVSVVINGQVIPALLDTGCPVTVLNTKAATMAGIQTVPIPSKPSRNTMFGSFLSGSQPVAAVNDVLTIMDGNGKPVNLIKSTTNVKVQLLDDRNTNMDLGFGTLYVGNIPGLAALNGISVESPPRLCWGWTFCDRGVPCY